MSKNNNHTPGQWKTSPLENSPDRTQGVDILSEDGETIATAHGNNGERNANAALMAAAPELLAVAEGVIRIESIWMPPPGKSNQYEQEYQALETMRRELLDVIKKARNQ